MRPELVKDICRVREKALNLRLGSLLTSGMTVDEMLHFL
jgi:hypothetical protein